MPERIGMVFCSDWRIVLEDIQYRQLRETEINESLFSDFNRFQDVKKCWRKENESWILKEIAFIEQWGSDDYKKLVDCLRGTIKTGGYVLGVFYNGMLVGFASIENEPFGSNKEYLQLSSIHTSFEYRGRGIGKELFSLVCMQAKNMGAEKLYISAHSSEESQAFYKAMGCMEAAEYNEKLVNEEPYDCQLEYRL